MARVVALTGKGRPGGRPRRGVSSANSRKTHVPLAVDDDPVTLDRAHDLEPRDVFQALLLDRAIPGWPVGGEPSVFARPMVDIPLNLARDIHCFVEQALKCRAPAYMMDFPASPKPTALGRELDRLFLQIKMNVPKCYEHHSEHVRLFLDTYVGFGLDGSEEDPEVLKYIGNVPPPYAFPHEHFLIYLRGKAKERVDPRRFAVNSGRNAAIRAAKLDPLRARYWERRKSRRERSRKITRASSALISDIFRRESSVQILRINLGVMPSLFDKLAGSEVDKRKKSEHYRNSNAPMSDLWFSREYGPADGFRKRLQVFFRAINKQIGPLSGVIGRIARLMWTPTRGLYCHVILFYSARAAKTKDDLLERIGNYWTMSVTNGIGVYDLPNEESSIYIRTPCGKISKSDKAKRLQLLQSTRYLSVIDEYISIPETLVKPGQDVFFLSELQTLKPNNPSGEKRKPGRPRRLAHE